MMNSRSTLSVLEAYGSKCELEPYFWVSANSHSPPNDFYEECPCLEWILCLLFEYHSDIAVEFLRTLLVDTWSRVDSRETISEEVADRVIALRTGLRGFDPPLEDTWNLEDDEAYEPVFELALCVSALAQTIVDLEAGVDTEVELGGYRDMRSLWIPHLSIPPTGVWQATFLDLNDREVNHDSAYADRFVLGRYRPSILRMLDEFQSK